MSNDDLLLSDVVAVAAVGVIGRAGADHLTVGYNNEDNPRWYAYVDYGKHRLEETHHLGPAQALDALARRLLEGAECQSCKGIIALSPYGVRIPTDGMFADGRPLWTPEEAAKLPQCLWARIDDRWVGGCEQ